MKLVEGKSVQEINVGDKASFRKTITESDVYLYTGISGDLNPAHVDDIYCKETAFKERIAHGILTAGLISNVLGNKLPGPGTIYVRQSLHFLAPVRFGDTIEAECEVIEVDVAKNRVKLKTLCINQHGKYVIEGEAVVSPPVH